MVVDTKDIGDVRELLALADQAINQSSDLIATLSEQRAEMIAGRSEVLKMLKEEKNEIEG